MHSVFLVRVWYRKIHWQSPTSIYTPRQKFSILQLHSTFVTNPAEKLQNIKQRCNLRIYKTVHLSIWAATWQNQQNECAPIEDSDQPGHPPSLIRVFAVHSVGSWGPKVSSCGQRRLWSDWANAQAELSLHWAHSHFVGYVMSRLISLLIFLSQFVRFKNLAGVIVMQVFMFSGIFKNWFSAYKNVAHVKHSYRLRQETKELMRHT